MANSDKIIFLKGNESRIAKLLLILALLIFFVPIVLILLLKLLYGIFRTAKKIFLEQKIEQVQLKSAY